MMPKALPRSPGLSSDENSTPKDYIFRYPLDLDSPKTPVYHHRLAELVRSTLESLLNIVVPRREGKDIEIDGFRWLMDKERLYKVFAERSTDPAQSAETTHCLSPGTGGSNGSFQSPQSAAFYEPRIDLIKKVIENLLSVVEFEHDGQIVRVDGFRLKDLGDWLVSSPGDPAEVFEYAGGQCTCDCVFCCNKGNPPSLAPCHNLNRTSHEELEEMVTRLKYLSPEGRRALFSSIGTTYEVTAHPYLIDILRSLREKTARPFRITTNGNTLSPDLVAWLAELKPLYLYLSLNSSSAARRSKLMRDPIPEVAINALPLLRHHGIPYAAVIVPWPVDTVDEMLADLRSTVAYAAEHEPHIVQVNLPGYTRHFSPVPLFDLDRVWRLTVSCVRELREKHDCPIVAMPTLYEENIYQLRKNQPQIVGLVKNSPAYFAGLKRGDLIQQVNGIRAGNRPQARDLLSIVQQSGAREASLKVQRNGQNLEVRVDLTRHGYPYSVEIDDYLGILFMGTGLRTSYLENLKEIIEDRRAERVLFLSSALVKPTFEQCLAESHLFNSQIKLDVEVPQNNFFGGNIFMGDLLVVQDFIDCIRNHIEQKGESPDLVVIASSPFNLSGWGRDLTGRVYLDIERETGVPVELLPCTTMYS